MDYQAVLSDLQFVCKQAGEKILEYYSQEFLDGQAQDFPVTEVDLVADKILQTGLRAKYPDTEIISEESKEKNLSGLNGKVFIIDPLDGTKDFVHKTGEFSVLVALVEDGRPVVGVVYRPVGDIFYYATKGNGAFVKEKGLIKKLTVSPEHNFFKMKIATSRFHPSEIELKLKEKLGVASEEKMGSAGLKMTRIAEGLAHVYINTSSYTGEWDTAAGSLIVIEAGGKVTDLNGEPLKFCQSSPYNKNGFVVSNGVNHNKILAELTPLL